MASPSTGILDTFNRANENPMSGWSHLYNSLAVVSNQAAGNNAVENVAVWNGGSYGPDVEAYVTIATKPGNGESVGVYARLQDTGSIATLDGYVVSLTAQSGTDEVEIIRFTNAVPQLLGSAISVEFNAGDKLGIQIVDDTITAWRHDGSTWINLGSRTDSTYTGAGAFGMLIEGTTGRLEDFGGGSLIAVTDTDTAMLSESQNMSTEGSSGSGSGESGVLPQSWMNSTDDVLIRMTADGRLQVGNEMLIATDDSLIEAHRDETEIAKPTRGLHLLGEITGALDNLVSWVVQELVLKGTGGISALHSALRVRLTNENTGTMASGADLRGADIEIINNGGSSGNNVPELTGLHVAVTNQAGAYADTAYGIRVRLNDLGDLETAYAIHTDVGLVHLGDVLELEVSAVPGTPDTDVMRLYPKSDGKLYAKNDAGVEYDLTGGSGGSSGLPQGYIAGFEVDCDGSEVFIQPGLCRDDSDDEDIKATAIITVDPATSGANGLVSGSLATDTWYYVFVIKGSSGVAGLLSTTESPTLPNGYDTAKRRVGMVKTEVAAASLYSQRTERGHGAWRVVLYQEAESGDCKLLTNANISTAGTSVDCSNVVPPTSRSLIGSFRCTAPSANTAIFWRENGVNDQVLRALQAFTTESNPGWHAYLPLDSNQVGVVFSNASSDENLNLAAQGYHDNLLPEIV